MRNDRTENHAQFVWCAGDAAARNAFALLRRTFRLEATPDAADLNLFVDARYRLEVNGVIAAYGPGRFLPSYPQYDTIDLRPFLRPGDNTLLLTCWSPNSSTYQTAPDSAAGCIAWGEIAGHDLATPGAWEAQPGTAWDATAPAFSFAQGPVEIRDLAVADHAWTKPVVRSGPWGAPAPREIPALGLRLRQFARLPLVAALDDAEERRSIRRLVPAFRKKGATKLRFPYAVELRSPTAQQVPCGLFWGPHFLNGRELAMATDPVLGNRQNTTLDLIAGSNLLYGEPEVLAEVWAQYLALPRSAGVEIGPIRHADALPEGALAAARGAVPASVADLARLPFAWAATTGGVPARDLAWDRPGRVIAQDAPAAFPLTLDPAQDRSGWVMVADAGGEFLGHVAIELDAPAGTVIDFAPDERLRADGLLGIYASNPFTDAADRLVWAGGRRSVELFHPRGGRYLQIAVRPPRGVTTAVTLHALALRDHQVPLREDGAFACADPVFDWTWAAGRRTLQACIEDAFLDCPWRERGTYLGDALVETASLAANSRDLSVAKRSMRLWAQAQRADGQVPCCVPSWHGNPHGDFTLLWVVLLHDLWRRDGMLQDAVELWPVAQRVLASERWTFADGLFDADRSHNLFLDWGVVPEDRVGAGNACLNAFRIRALACAAELADALGRRDEAQCLRSERGALVARFRERLWIAEDGRFARRLVDGKPDREGDAVHANVLALWSGAAGPDQDAACLAHVERLLAQNTQRGILGRRQGSIDLYFLSYTLEALYARGRTATAEAVVREHYGFLMSHGAWTIWEGFGHGAAGVGSLCHAWSTTPLRWFHERVLGVSWQAGDPGQVTVAPDSLLPWAEGAVPHPAGVIRVAWRRDGGVLDLRVSAPPGVQVRTAAGPGCSGLRLRSVSDRGH